jgi:4-coumarate--CoA ligase (photoactive yellow protein activation family)
MIRSLFMHAPGDPVAVGEGGTRTAVDLHADAGRVARRLAALAPGEILLVCDDRYLFAVALLGAWSAGHAVLLPPNGQPETLRALAADPHVRAFLDDRGGADGRIDVRALLRDPASPWVPPELPPSRHVATLATSGSTGPHKRCPKTAAQLLGEATGLLEVFQVTRGARVLASVPPHHIYGLLFGVLMPLRAGAAFVRETPLHPEAVAAAAARAEATHLVSVPAHLASLAHADALPRFARVFSSGAPLPAATARGLVQRFGWRVTEVFGSSETGGIAWRDDPDHPWQPFPGVKVSIGDDDRLLLDSPLLAPAAPRPLPCADRIARGADGRFELLGRADGVVKVGGKRVSLREVEERLLGLPGVEDAAALAARVDGPRGEEIWVAAAAPGWSAERLRRALAAWLDPVTLPRRIRLVEKLPREVNGKLQRERLHALFEGSEAVPIPRRAVLHLDPESESVEADAQGAEVRRLGFLVPAELVFFDGHFDGMPVLPGIAQLDELVLRQTARFWPDMGGVQSIVRLKFRRPILPGMRIELRLVRRRGELRVDFGIESPSGPCASGTLVFRDPGATK